MNWEDKKWLKRILWGVLILTIWNYPKVLLSILLVPVAMIVTIAGLLFPGCSSKTTAPEPEPVRPAQQTEDAKMAEREQNEAVHLAIRQEVNRFAREYVPETWASLQEANVRKELLEQQVEKVGKACDEANVPKLQDVAYQRACTLLRKQEQQCADLERAIREAYRASLVAEGQRLMTQEETARTQQGLQELERLMRELSKEAGSSREEDTPSPPLEKKGPSLWEGLWD